MVSRARSISPPLLDEEPLFEDWRDESFFASVKVSQRGVPEWGEDMDLSPGSLRAWCEAGRLLSPDETDAWIREHSRLTETVA
jgi:hypothetical protein